MTALEMKNLWFRYDEDSEAILKNINITFEYGKMILIAGDSGCGKSTFISLINGEIPNYKQGQISGEIFVNGISNRDKSIAQLSLQVGSVLQNADSQIANEIVDDELAFGMENLGIQPEAMKKTIQDLCLRMHINADAINNIIHCDI